MDLLAQCYAVDQLHSDEVRATVLADLEDLRDVRMTECGSGLSFLNKAAHPIFVGSSGGGQDFQRDQTAQGGVLGQINFAHATFAEQRANLIAVDSSSLRICPALLIGSQ